MTLETPQQLPSAYDPASVEQRLYQKWMDAGYFTPAIQPGKAPLCRHPAAAERDR